MTLQELGSLYYLLLALVAFVSCLSFIISMVFTDVMNTKQFYKDYRFYAPLLVFVLTYLVAMAPDIIHYLSLSEHNPIPLRYLTL